MLEYVTDRAVFIGVLVTTLTAVAAVGALVVQMIIHRSSLSVFFGKTAKTSRGRRWFNGTMLVLAGMIWAGLLCAHSCSGPAPGAGAELGELLLTQLEHYEYPDGPLLSTNEGLLSERKSKTRAWLRATGDVSFILTGITITHSPGNASSVQSGTVVPDEQYTYGFEYGKEVTRALDPPLRIVPGDPVMFELSLVPADFFPAIGGAVSVVLRYRSDDERQARGTLELRETSDETGRDARIGVP